MPTISYYDKDKKDYVQIVTSGGGSGETEVVISDDKPGENHPKIWVNPKGVPSGNEWKFLGKVKGNMTPVWFPENFSFSELHCVTRIDEYMSFSSTVVPQEIPETGFQRICNGYYSGPNVYGYTYFKVEKNLAQLISFTLNGQDYTSNTEFYVYYR